MRNHFHLVMETREANLVAGMRWLLSSYTIRLNHRHKLHGHVFSGRYKALVVDGSGDGYLRTVCDYVHLNPVRAKLVRSEDRLLGYPWSSLGWYMAAPEHRPGWIRVDRLLGEHGIGEDSPAGRREFEQQMEARRFEANERAVLKFLRRGWFLGGEDFRKQLLERMDGQLGEHHSGELRRETAEMKAERIIAAELKRLGWPEGDLSSRRKSDPDKLALGIQLRRQTTLSIKWIADRLHLGTSKGANTNLHHWGENHPETPSGSGPRAGHYQVRKELNQRK